MKHSYLIKTATIILALIFISNLTSCSDDEDDNTPTVQGSHETIFALNFCRDLLNDSQEAGRVRVDFATNDASVIPEVKINNVVMLDFYNDGGGIDGSIELPYTEEMTYSISANDKSITGTINIPDTIANVRVNNQSVNIGSNDFTPVSTYQIEWESPTADFIKISYRVDDIRTTEYLNNETYTASVGTQNSFNFYLHAINGCQMTTGSLPNVTGSYGKGYVNAKTETGYNLYSGYKSLPDNSLKEYRENQFRKFKSDFNTLLELNHN